MHHVGLFQANLGVVDRADRSRGDRPPSDAVLMFRILVLQTLYTLSEDQAEYQLRDRLSFMRFVGLALHDPVPDARRMGLVVRTIGLVRATAKIMLANLVYNMRRLVWIDGRSAPA